MSNRTDGGKIRRGGLGRGLGALIPTAPTAPTAPTGVDDATAAAAHEGVAAASVVPLRETPGADPLGTGEKEAVSGEAPTALPDTAATGTAAANAGAVGTPADDQQELLPVPGVTFLDIAISSIHANAKQPRQVFDEDAMAELTHSIRAFGVLQPIVVRRDTTAASTADTSSTADAVGYELVMGERRLRAAAAAGLETIPAIIRDTADDAMLRDALLENIHRAQLNPLEEAAAYQQLLEEFGTTHDELAQRIGRSRPQVSNTIRLLNLPIPVQRRVAAGVLSAGHARALLSLDDKDKQDEIAGRIVAEGLSVRATEELVTLTLRGHSGTRHSRAGSVQRITAPAITELADKLSDVFDTRVRVELGRRKGKITVEFGSINDLERLVAMMAPDLATRRPGND